HPVLSPLSLHDALPISDAFGAVLDGLAGLLGAVGNLVAGVVGAGGAGGGREAEGEDQCQAGFHRRGPSKGWRAGDCYPQVRRGRSEEHTSELQSLAYLV